MWLSYRVYGVQVGLPKRRRLPQGALGPGYTPESVEARSGLNHPGSVTHYVCLSAGDTILDHPQYGTEFVG